MRRFTRLTNGFSKKGENQAYAMALHYMYCNFIRLHGEVRVSLARGLASRIGCGRSATSWRWSKRCVGNKARIV